MRTVFVLILSLLLLSACNTAKTHSITQSYFDEWVGRPAAELVEAWGIPDRIREIQNIKIYEFLLPKRVMHRNRNSLDFWERQNNSPRF